jgi:uncharacterized repeat protein (TIGR03803 family)
MLVLAGCGGGGSSSPAPSPTPSPAPAPTPTPTPTPTPAVTIDYFQTFGPEIDAPAQPSGALLRASDGNLYGITQNGGRNICDGGNRCGTVFRVTPSGAFSIIHEFGATAAQGFQPSGPLIEAPDGALLGVAAAGGTFGGGVIFRLTKDGQYQVLKHFGADPADGRQPIGRLARAADGSYYGVTVLGGANRCSFVLADGNNCGALFRLSANFGTTDIVHSFGGAATAPVKPRGVVFNPADGNVYGTTEIGGAVTCQAPTGFTAGEGCGTVFRFVPGGTVSVIHDFGGANGLAPQGPPVIGPDGALYGTTVAGGAAGCGSNAGCGVVYRITTAGQFSLLHRFGLIDARDGHGPGGYPIFGSDGLLYGVTRFGGDNGNVAVGTAWRLTTAGVKTVLQSFGPFESSAYEPVDGMAEVQPGVFVGAIRNNAGITTTTRTNGRLFRLGVR